MSAAGSLSMTAVSSFPQRLRDYLELTKPRLSSLVLVTTAAGFWLGVREVGSLSVLIPVCVGTALVVGGANAMNQWMERIPDALMSRTQHRPLPSGRLTPTEAFRFGVVLSGVGILFLAVAVNGLSALLAVIGWVSYVLIYTPLKRMTPLCTVVGAIPGALPPVIGWAGAGHGLGIEAWILFVILFVWQFPHFLALAVMYRDDFARAGFRFLPIGDRDGLATARQMTSYGLALLPASLFPAMIGLGGPVYFFGALGLSLVFLGITLRAAIHRSLLACQHLFLASVLYLPGLLALLACDRAPL